jgi:hypothetical protein
LIWLLQSVRISFFRKVVFARRAKFFNLAFCLRAISISAFTLASIFLAPLGGSLHYLRKESIDTCFPSWASWSSPNHL